MIKPFYSKRTFQYKEFRWDFLENKISVPCHLFASNDRKFYQAKIKKYTVEFNKAKE